MSATALSGVSPNYHVIDDVPSLQAFLAGYMPDPILDSPPTLYVDLPGRAYASALAVRRPSLMTILIKPATKIGVLDLAALGREALTTSDDRGVSILDLLTDPDATKYCWDAARTGRALWVLMCADDHREKGDDDNDDNDDDDDDNNNNGDDDGDDAEDPPRMRSLAMGGWTSIQLMENMAHRNPATDEHAKRLVGLKTAVQNDLPERMSGRKANFKKMRRMVGELGDCVDDVLRARPLDGAAVKYCVNNVRWLPALRDAYEAEIGPADVRDVYWETRRLVQDTQEPEWDMAPVEKGVSPWYEAWEDDEDEC
jgi:exonuclease 3'-5' domain-containing protein 1